MTKKRGQGTSKVPHGIRVDMKFRETGSSIINSGI